MSSKNKFKKSSKANSKSNSKANSKSEFHLTHNSKEQEIQNVESVENNNSQEIKKGNESEKKSNYSVYINSSDNLNKLENLKKDLRGENKYLLKYLSILDNLKEEKTQLNNCYQNGELMNENLLQKDKYIKLNDVVFEIQAVKIFSEVYNLKEKILYPFFTVERSRTKSSNTLKLYYYKIEIKRENEERICFSFPIIIDTFLIHLNENPIIIQKKSENDIEMSIISKDFNHSKDFYFLKTGDQFQVSLTYADITDELFQIEEKVKETKNKIDSLNYTDIKEKYQKIEKK